MERIAVRPDAYGIGGIPAYMDSDHISAPMARSLAPRLRTAILEALAER